MLNLEFVLSISVVGFMDSKESLGPVVGKMKVNHKYNIHVVFLSILDVM